MTRDKMAKSLAVGFGLLAALAIVGFFLVPVALGLESEGPPQLEVGDRAAESIEVVLERGQETGVAPEVADTAQLAQPEIEALDAIEGEWRIAGDSVAGYRVFKDFVGAAEFEAVGRTSQVVGNLTIEGSAVTEGSFNVDIASVRSDDSRRDAQFVGPILNAAEYPVATFVLTSPIELGEAAAGGAEVTTDVTGELTLRGVTREVVFPLTARLVGGEVQVAGSIDVVFADYDIEAPFTPTIVVRDEGIIEFSLFFEMS